MSANIKRYRVKPNAWNIIRESTVPSEQIAMIGDVLRTQTMGFGLSPKDPSLLLKLAAKMGLESTADETSVLSELNEMIKIGYRPVLKRTAAGSFDWVFTAIDKKVKPHIMLVETHAVTSFFGNYGVGKTVRTFSLLPGEKTKISVKTWKSSETNYKQASSVLDSWSKDSSESLEIGIQSENTKRDSIQEANSWYVDAEVKAHGGMGVWGAEASVKGGAKGSTNTSRENTAKNVSNATSKHVENVASKRNVEVNTSFEAKVTSGEEQTIERELENVNSGRVLNFVFRQLNQEFITYLHLVDVRLAFTDGHPYESATYDPQGNQVGKSLPDPDHYREFTIGEIEEFLNYCIRNPKAGETVNPKDEVRRIIVDELSSIFGYNGVRFEFIESVDITTGKAESASSYLDDNRRFDENGNLRLYLRVKKQPFYQNQNSDLPSYEKHKIDGIILAKSSYVLPTDSLVVEALLGQAEALDKYSIDSRNAIIEEKKAAIQKVIMANEIIASRDEAKAKIYRRIYPPPVQIIDRKDGTTNSEDN